MNLLLCVVDALFVNSIFASSSIVVLYVIKELE